jgi:UDP-N-acetylmuramoyl-tripeptide--D-alanyl-D-alanine ligase
VTQCAPAHLEGFGSIEGVAAAKGEIFATLREDGIAVINADDDFASQWREMAGKRNRLSFGLREAADVRAVIQDDKGNRFELQTPSGATEISLQLAGRHNVMNALAAATCAQALGVSLKRIQQGLERMQPVSGRLEVKLGPRGCRLLDDTYNANSGSVRAALSVLGGYPGERWFVLGDMSELGAQAVPVHHQVGRLARQAGVDRLYATGELSRHAVAGFGADGRYFTTVDELIRKLREELHGHVTILVKGSRAARMETVVARLLTSP